MSDLRIRTAEHDDLERLVEIHTASYPSDASFERRKRSFTHPSLGDFGAVRVVEREGRIVAHAKLYDVQIWLGGAPVQSGAVGSLAVAPEARGAGVARWLMGQMHAEMEERGAALSLLYPFREAFYAELGYATSAPRLTLNLDAHALARVFPRSRVAEFDALPVDGAWLTRARELYAETARGEAGRLTRTEMAWARMLASDARQVLGLVSRAGGELCGYVVLTYECPVPNGRQILVVHELTARGAEARSALLALLGQQRDQVDEVELTLPWGDPLVFAIQDACGARRGTSAVMHPVGRLGAGPMVRLVDVRRALEQRGYLSDGELTLRCAGEAVGYRLAVREGRGEVSVLAQGAPCEIEVPRAVLGSMLAAGIRPEEAARLGWLVGGNAAQTRAEALLAGPRFEALDSF